MPAVNTRGEERLDCGCVFAYEHHTPENRAFLTVQPHDLGIEIILDIAGQMKPEEFRTWVRWQGGCYGN